MKAGDLNVGKKNLRHILLKAQLSDKTVERISDWNVNGEVDPKQVLYVACFYDSAITPNQLEKLEDLIEDCATPNRLQRIPYIGPFIAKIDESKERPSIFPSEEERQTQEGDIDFLRACAWHTAWYIAAAAYAAYHFLS